MIDRIKMQFANDVWQLYLRNIPLQKAIQQVRYIMNVQEVNQAKRELMQIAKNREKQADDYKREGIGKEMHLYKQRHGCFSTKK
jgi:hypothetical protein